MTLFGKDTAYLEVVAADFLPDGNKLYILVADSECNLHVLQYDPEGKPEKTSDLENLQAHSLSFYIQIPNRPTEIDFSTGAHSTWAILHRP